MSNLGFAFVALFTASIITALELITTKYPRTFFVLTPFKCPALYGYSFIYGLLAFVIVLSGILHLEGTPFSNQWLQAILVGLSIKALLHIRFFSVPASDAVGSDPIPIGLETIVHIFEPQLLRQIELDEYNGIRTFILERAKAFPEPDFVRQQMMQNLPSKLRGQDRVAFEEDLKYALREDGEKDLIARVADAMEIYLEFMDKRTLDRVFDLSKSGLQATGSNSQ